MPIHDWTRVHSDLFYTFHHSWISAIKSELNARRLPRRYYALAEWNGRKSRVGIRSEIDDSVVTMIDIVLPEEKASRESFKAFVDGVRALLNRRINLLILDPFPPTSLHHYGIHSAIWEQIEADVVFLSPADKPLTLVAYEAGADIAAFIEPVAIGDILPNMPVILEPGGAVELLLEETYQSAFAAYPLRWRTVLEAPEVR